MERDQTIELLLAAAFGTLSGMRAVAGPALAATLRTLNEDESGVLEDHLNGQKPVAVLGALALAEVVADKLPIGDRTDMAPLIARALAGALAGAMVCRSEDPDRVGLTALTGSAAAIGATFAAYHLRRSLSENTDIPDGVLAVAEDVLVYGSGALLLQQLVED